MFQLNGVHELLLQQRRMAIQEEWLTYRLSMQCQNVTHFTHSPYHQAMTVPKNMLKTISDAWNGFHSIPIAEEDQHKTMFITEYGSNMYKRGPQGWLSTGDAYTARFDSLTEDIKNKTKCIDDTVSWNKDLESAFWDAIRWLERCGSNGIILNPEKFEFAKEDVEFAGFIIGMDDVKPSKKITEGIRNFPIPKNISDMRAFFGPDHK